MLEITSITNGIVMDHIKPGLGMKIYKYLELDNIKDCQIALIMNANSPKSGKKDIIKIENLIDIDLEVLGILDPHMTINIIKNEKVVEKIKPKLPETIQGIFTCKNPRCITTAEREIEQRFDLVEKEEGLYRCHYCDMIHKF